MWMFVAAAVHGVTPALEYEVFEQPPTRVFDLSACGSAPSSGSVREEAFSWNARRQHCAQMRVMRGLLPSIAACHSAAVLADPDNMELYYRTIDVMVGIEAGRAKLTRWLGGRLVGSKMLSCVAAAINNAHFAATDGYLIYRFELREP